MDASDEQLERVKEKLERYQEQVVNGEQLNRQDDYLELDVTNGRIWLHPQDDGHTVDIHLFDDEQNRDYRRARSRIITHLTIDIGFREAYTPFIGPERMHIRVDYDELLN